MKLIALAASAAVASAQIVGAVTYQPATAATVSYQPYRPVATTAAAAGVGAYYGARVAQPAMDPMMMMLLLKKDDSNSKKNDNLLMFMMMSQGGMGGSNSMLPLLLLNKDSEDCPTGKTVSSMLGDAATLSSEANFYGCFEKEEDSDLFLIMMMQGGMGSNSYLPLLLQDDVSCTGTAAAGANAVANQANYAAACKKYNKDQEDDMLLMMMMNGGLGGGAGLW